ncbi:MAG TPA: ATP-binding protein, partial [Blastocatellia bacterium]|nr:ATP-binding protein [Blastocatellia bacterium]
ARALDEQQKSEFPSTSSERKRRRATTVIVLSIIVLLLMLSLIAQSGFNPDPYLSPETAGETLLLYALSTLNFLAFITLLFVLLRNMLKLVRERRAGRLGSKFKARLVGYAIGLSLLPVLLLFFFAFGLLNRSIDRWFGGPARQIAEDAQALEEAYFKREEEELASIARAIARSLAPAAQAHDNRALRRALKQEVSDHRLALARVIVSDKRIAIASDDYQARQEIESALLRAERRGRSEAATFTVRDEGADPQAIYFVAAVNLTDAPGGGRLIVAREFPQELARRAASISAQKGSFDILRSNIKRIKDTYILLLGAVALLLIFASVWLALHVARGITVPIQALAEATERVATGDFAHPVRAVAEDELAGLVTSFNQMAAQLAENRCRLERVAEDLRLTNQELDNRRLYIETVLESLSTGVISTDENAGVATINRAALHMLGLSEKPSVGTPLRQLTAGPQGEEMAALCRRARRSRVAQTEIEFKRPDGSALYTATTAILLRGGEGSVEGWVIVMEDLTDLIQAERAAAWSEVARRMAHEIKNPLTPIMLSAERIKRNYERLSGERAEQRFGEVVREGTTIIVREATALQRMVEEFSRFARLPEARLVETSLNDVVRDALSLYADRLDGVRLECDLAPDMPPLLLDAEQMKRVLVNLIDNAIEALTVNNGDQGNGGNGKPREGRGKIIRIESRYQQGSDVARLIVSDTGHGIRPADRDKLFLPKFSTRDRGTGLGLAIVSHIIADHKGRIWVEDNRPCGARFIIELPAGRGD